MKRNTLFHKALCLTLITSMVFTSNGFAAEVSEPVAVEQETDNAVALEETEVVSDNDTSVTPQQEVTTEDTSAQDDTAQTDTNQPEAERESEKKAVNPDQIKEIQPDKVTDADLASTVITDNNLLAGIAQINAKDASTLTVGELANLTNGDLSEYANANAITSMVGLSYLKNVTAFNLSTTSISEIPDGAFTGCTKLTSVILPTGITYIGEYAFYACEALVNLSETTSAGKVVIPDTILEMKPNAFNGCSSVESIEISSGVGNAMMHANSAFAGCTKLRTISIGKNVTAIPEHAFDNAGTAGAGVAVTIEAASKLEGIGVAAFANANLALLDLSNCKDMNKIEDSAFSNSKLSQLILPTALNTGKSLQLGANVFAESAIEKMGAAAELSVVIPEYVTVTEKSKAIFKKCTRLTSVTIPDHWTLIPTETFYGAGPEEGSLTVNIKNSQNTTLKKIDVRAFEESKLSSVGFVSKCVSLETIESEAFAQCDNIATVKLPASLITVGKYAFAADIEKLDTSKNTALTSVEWESDTIGKTRSIGEAAFIAHKNLETVVLPEQESDLITIEKNAFRNNIGLKKVGVRSSSVSDSTFPISVCEIGDEAFRNCPELTKVTVQYNSRFVFKLGIGAFEKCTKLADVSLPNTMTEIPAYAFCRAGVERFVMGSVANVINNSSLEKIGYYAFFAPQMTSVDLSACPNLHEIGGWAFAAYDSNRAKDNKHSAEEGGRTYVTKLKKVILPDEEDRTSGHLFINSGVFQSDALFTTIVPKSMDTEGNEGWVWLPDYVYNATPARIGVGEGTFSTTMIQHVRIPASWTDAFPKGLFGRCINLERLDFLTDENNLSHVSGFGEDCFRECIALSDVNLYSNPYIKSIGKNCFASCISIDATAPENFTLPCNLEKIGEGAFSAITGENFKYVDLSQNSKLNNIDRDAFKNCTTLKKFRFPESGVLQRTGDNIFENDIALEQVSFGGVTVVGGNAFKNCIAFDVPKTPTTDPVELGYRDWSKLVTINSSAFEGCKALNLTDVSLASLDKICSNAFKGDYSLGTVKFSDKLTKIEGSAFRECYMKDEANSGAMDERFIVNFDFSQATALNTIDGEAFSKSAIKTIDLTATDITKINNRTFKSCDLLTTVKFGQKVEYVDDNALAGCKNLSNIYIYSATNLSKNLFKDKSEVSHLPTKSTLAINVTPVQKLIKLGIGEEDTVFPFYVLPNDAEKASYTYIVAGAPSASGTQVPASEKDNMFMGVKGNFTDGYYMNSWTDDGANKILQDFTKLDSDEVITRRLGGSDRKLKAFKISAKYAKKYPVYVSWSYVFEAENNESPVTVNSTTEYLVETVDATYRANLYNEYKDNKLSKQMSAKNINNHQVTSDGNTKNLKTYFDFQYVENDMDSRNISDYNVYVVSDNPAVIYPSRGTSDNDKNAGKAGSITTNIGERDKNNADRKFFYLIPAGIGRAKVKVYPSNHIPGQDPEAEKYALTYEIIVNADLSGISLKIPESLKDPNVNATGTILFKVKNCLDQEVELTGLSELYKYTNNTVNLTSELPNLVAVDPSGVVRVISNPAQNTGCKITAEAVVAENRTVKGDVTINVKILEAKEGKSFVDDTTGATVLVTKVDGSSGEATYFAAPAGATGKVSIPSTVKIGTKTLTVTKVDKAAFKNAAVTAVVIPKTVTEIGDSAFENCKNLKSVTIPAGVTSIGKKAFSGCKNLKKITFKTKVLTKIGSKAFKGIHKKATIKLPAAKREDYKKLLKKKGQPKTVKIK